MNPKPDTQEILLHIVFVMGDITDLILSTRDRFERIELRDKIEYRLKKLVDEIKSIEA